VFNFNNEQAIEPSSKQAANNNNDDLLFLIPLMFLEVGSLVESCYTVGDLVR